MARRSFWPPHGLFLDDQAWSTWLGKSDIQRGISPDMDIEPSPIQPDGDRLCAHVARGLGEAPIGSANPFQQCLVLEFPLPWATEVTASRGFPKGLLEAVEEARKEGEIPLLAIAPDPQYSTPGFTRVMLFRYPSRPSPPAQRRSISCLRIASSCWCRR
ncbi:MAG: hypothetical protein GKR89_08925 [Candidatus Latescibacteria bacterium]|nr:hypothetical protein [Candidatus Latescibacterota bacterium]